LLSPLYADAIAVDALATSIPVIAAYPAGGGALTCGGRKVPGLCVAQPAANTANTAASATASVRMTRSLLLDCFALIGRAFRLPVLPRICG
jgi:hypothetical protein